MKRKLKVVLGLSHLAFLLALFGCSTSTDSHSDSTDETDTNSSSIEKDDNEKNSTEVIESSSNSDEEENKLAGTCPKGRHCSAPGQCHLFSDSNDNDLCDRGE